MHCSTQNSPKTVIRTNIYQYCQSFKKNSWIEGVSVALNILFGCRIKHSFYWLIWAPQSINNILNIFKESVLWQLMYSDLFKPITDTTFRFLQPYLGTCEWDWLVQMVNAIPKLKLPIITFVNTVMNWLDGWLLNGKQSGTFQVGNQDNLSIQMLKCFVLKTTRFYASFLNG